MLQLVQVTSAPSALSVSISTAVWIVMCRQPATRAPLSGCLAPYSRRSSIRPGISVSAIWISLRPQSARLRSATLYFWLMSLSIVVLRPAGRSSIDKSGTFRDQAVPGQVAVGTASTARARDRAHAHVVQASAAGQLAQLLGA